MPTVIEIDGARTPAMKLGLAVLEATLREAPEALNAPSEDGIVVALDPACLRIGRPVLYALADAGIARADRTASEPVCVSTTVQELLCAMRARGLNGGTIDRLELNILTARAISPRKATLFMVAGEGTFYIDRFLLHTEPWTRQPRGIS